MPEIFYPRDNTLRKYIRYMYRVSSDDPGFQRQLVLFPNAGSAIAIYEDVDFCSDSYQEFSSFEKNGNKNIILHLNRKDPVTIREKGKQKRIVIVIGPLGINHFMDVPPGALLKSNNPTLIPLIPVDRNFIKFCDLIPINRPLSESGPLIEELLLERINEFSNAFLESCVSALMTSDSSSRIEEIALKKKVSEKTLNRQFHKYIGLSPVEFRKIIQFRHAISLKLENNSSKHSDIALESNYYDLPYMTKVFKKMTGISASDFFHKISSCFDKQYVYIG